jgi:hypothetical protein
MKLPTLATFCDVTATALLLAGMLLTAYSIGALHAQREVREDCDGLSVVLLGGDRYECISSPRGGQ